jgi:hypothetical protein
LTPTRISDPRRFDGAKESPLSEATDQFTAASVPEKKQLLPHLSQRISTMLENGEESIVREEVSKPASPSACRALLQALELALLPGGGEGDVSIQVFAIPVLFVVGGASSAQASGVVRDTDEIRVLFETAGVLGQCRNFGLSNALAAKSSIEAIPWATLRSISHNDTWDGLGDFDLPPADIPVIAHQETVYLRFLTGAALTPGDAPGFIQVAGDIGRWGFSLSRLLGRQLAGENLSMLAIPRPPANIVRAVQEGCFAARELGFQLFLSNALREARLSVGEPDVTISSRSDETICIRLTSPFDDLFDQTYGWNLTYSDEIDTIVRSILGLLKEARVERIQVVPTIEDVAEAGRTPH